MMELHSALKTKVIQEASESGLHLKHVRLQHGKDDFLDTLHIRPTSWSSDGLQSTDLLSFLGFKRSPCAFHVGECYVSQIPSSLDVPAFAKSCVVALGHLETGARHLKNCGLGVPQPKGVGFFYRKPSLGHQSSVGYTSGNGHVAPKVERVKESEDEHFRYILTCIEGAGAKGWSTHYRAKHMPLSPEFTSALSFIGEFSTFDECPEFDFEMCWWRFVEFKQLGRTAEYVYRCFDAHADNFSPGLKSLLAAHVELQRHGFSFLNISTGAPPLASRRSLPREQTEQKSNIMHELEEFDLAISFAGTERQQAKQLAERVREAGFKVFYDDFYPEQLWGKDLVAFFDKVYRKASRYCVMFISAEYQRRIWTTHERRSAQARALQEKGREYILPVRVDDTDLDGLPPTVGYLSLGQYEIDEIAELLIRKLQQ
jgi:hypothetical protein